MPRTNIANPFLPAIIASLVLVHQRVVELAGRALVVKSSIILGLKNSWEGSEKIRAEQLGVIHGVQTLLTFRSFAYIPSELQTWHLHALHTKRTIFDLPALPLQDPSKQKLTIQLDDLPPTDS